MMGLHSLRYSNIISEAAPTSNSKCFLPLVPLSGAFVLLKGNRTTFLHSLISNSPQEAETETKTEKQVSLPAPYSPYWQILECSYSS